MIPVCVNKSIFKSLGLHRNIPNYLSRCYIHLTTLNNLNCHRSCIGKIGRSIYNRMYPVILVFSDGSTINIRYHEPRGIIKLPLDITTLTEAQRKKILDNRKPKAKVVIEEDIEDPFDLDSYKHLWKK